MNYWDLMKRKSFCTAKGTIDKTKRQPMEWGKIFANDISDKGLVFKIYKELTKRYTRKTNNPVKKWMDTFPKKTSWWPTDTWKDAQCHSSSGQYKSKPHWDTTSHRSEWLKWTNQETIDAGKDVERQEPFCTFGGNVNWCGHSGKQCGGSSKN